VIAHAAITRRAPQRSAMTPIGTCDTAYVQKYAVWMVPAAA